MLAFGFAAPRRTTASQSGWPSSWSVGPSAPWSTKRWLLALRVANGVGEGELIVVTTTTGEELEVEVPGGVGPGDTFEVAVG